MQAVEGVPAAQRAAFAADVSPLVPGFGDAVYPDWRALFSALKARWPAGRPPVLVIDEFPYLAATAPDLPPVLQALVDVPETRRMPLVLCGSSQRLM